MKRYDVRLKRGSMELTEPDIAVLFHSGAITRETACSEVGKNQWQSVDELFPLMKYEGASSRNDLGNAPAMGNYPVQNGSQNSAMRAGWICFGMGAAVSWIFPPAYVFFSVAIVLAVVAMATNQVNRGLVLLLGSFFGMGMSALISFLLAVGLFTAAAGHAISKVEEKSQSQRAAFNQQVNQFGQASQHLIKSLPTSPPQNGPGSMRPPARGINQLAGTTSQSAARQIIGAIPTPTAAPPRLPSVQEQLRRIEADKQKRESYKVQSESIRRLIDYWQKAGRGSQGSTKAFAQQQVDALQKQLEKMNSENLGM